MSSISLHLRNRSNHDPQRHKRPPRDEEWKVFPTTGGASVGVERKQNEAKQHRDALTNDIVERMGLRPHPHAGALDEDGNPGYVHDASHVRRNPLAFDFTPNGSVCDLPQGDGIEGLDGIHGLRKIHIHKTLAPTRVLCIVYTYDSQHETVLRAIAETYAPKCDGFLAASNQTDQSIGAVHILHKGPEAYYNMWQKVRSIWAYVYDHYLDDYDWFHLGGDNMYVIAENLRHAVHQEDQQHQDNGSMPVLLGFTSTFKRRLVCSGGSGYTLNREAVRVMVGLHYNKYYCNPDLGSPKEDVWTSSCLDIATGIACTHSVDEMEETRYHPLDVEFHSQWQRWKPSTWKWKVLLSMFGIRASAKEGLESISSSSVSFHLTGHKGISTTFPDKGIRRYHALLYRLCENHEYVPFDPNVTLPCWNRRCKGGRPQ